MSKRIIILKEYRKIGKKRYKLSHLTNSKKEAKRLSEGNRKGGLYARVLKNKQYGYAIYTRSKRGTR